MNTQYFVIASYIVGIVILIPVFYEIIKIIKERELEPKIIELITEAEDKLNDKEGKEKFDYVFDKLYNTFAPKFVRFLFSPNEIKAIIQFVFDKIKIALDYKGE